MIQPRRKVHAEELLTFIEIKPFTRRWTKLKLSDDDLAFLQIAIMCDPAANPVIEGTGGLRKMRFAPPDWKTGKRGACRVCYVYFEELKIVLLVTVYPKNERDDLNAADKKAIRQLIETIEREL